MGRYFRSCVHALHSVLKPLIHWPDRDALHETMPECLKESFGNKVSVIIDCFEVFIQSPSNLSSKAECWSNYKYHKTAKNLIGITPQGTICFISDSWGGRASDKFITKNSGFMNHLRPGDLVLADGGFTIQEVVRFIGAEAKIPAFTRGEPVELKIF